MILEKLHKYMQIIKLNLSWCQWLTPVILATQEAEITRTTLQSQPRQIILRPYLKKTYHKKRIDGVAQDVGPEFKTICKHKQILKIQ
jgi:hypothetical protein